MTVVCNVYSASLSIYFVEPFDDDEELFGGNERRTECQLERVLYEECIDINIANITMIIIVMIIITIIMIIIISSLLMRAREYNDEQFVNGRWSEIAV